VLAFRHKRLRDVIENAAREEAAPEQSRADESGEPEPERRPAAVGIRERLGQRQAQRPGERAPMFEGMSGVRMRPPPRSASV
jgi:hypothetical protein